MTLALEAPGDKPRIERAEAVVVRRDSAGPPRA
jgi:hypothetical protein